MFIKIKIFCNRWFLFSLSSSDLSDPFEYIYKINRDSYFNKIKLKMLINNDIGFECENYLLIHNNNIQFLNASLVEHLLNKLNLITIYDCFGVRLCELHFLI